MHSPGQRLGVGPEVLVAVRRAIAEISSASNFSSCGAYLPLDPISSKSGFEPHIERCPKRRVLLTSQRLVEGCSAQRETICFGMLALEIIAQESEEMCRDDRAKSMSSIPAHW